MDHSDKISLVVEKARVRTGRALKVLPLDRRNDEPEAMIRGIMSQPPRTALRLCAILNKGFEFFDSEGLRVTIAIGRGECSSDDVQSWWIPRRSLVGENGTESSFKEFYTWISTTAKGSKGQIPAPAYAHSGRHCFSFVQK